MRTTRATPEVIAAIARAGITAAGAATTAEAHVPLADATRGETIADRAPAAEEIATGGGRVPAGRRETAPVAEVAASGAGLDAAMTGAMIVPLRANRAPLQPQLRRH